MRKRGLAIILMACCLPFLAATAEHYEDGFYLKEDDSYLNYYWSTLKAQNFNMFYATDPQGAEIGCGVGRIEPGCLVEVMIACRVRGDDQLCRYASDRSYRPDVFPSIPDTDRTLVYKFLSHWRLDGAEIPAWQRQEGAIQALVATFECRGMFRCEGDKQLYTFVKTPAGWIVSDVTTPWCLREKRDTLPPALRLLRPLVRMVGKIICDGALVPPDPDLPPLHRLGEGQIITRTGGTSSCIGSLASPVCTLDTLLASRTREDSKLWYAAGMDDVPYWDAASEKNETDMDFNIRYQIVGVRRLTKNNIPIYYQEDSTETDPERTVHSIVHYPRPFWRPGDVQIQAVTWYCFNSDCYDGTEVPTFYTTRWDGQFWRIVDDYTPDRL